MTKVWRTLEALYKRGVIKALGVSNFGVDELDRIMSHASGKL